MFLVWLLFILLTVFSPIERSALHAQWDALLRRYVKVDGRVNYKGLATNRAKLKAYLRVLSQHPPTADWSRAEKMAYWINAYNAWTIDLVLEHYPIRSIMELDGGKTWQVKRIEIGGERYSSNDIENRILRPEFGDARIHFVINCAARSCPPLYNRAYTADNVELLLEERTRQFISDSRFNRITASRADISKIFDWYATDFGDVRSFLARYSGVDLLPTATIHFLEYDWSLNE